MKPKQLITGLTASTAMLTIILDGHTALGGARDGISLCVQTVIPSLFPFLVLSILQTNALAGISPPFLRTLGRFYGIPSGSESILISGYLGGYPVGAQSVSSAYRSGTLRKDTAERMLSFCSNAGPAFLFGMVSSAFPDLRFAWLLWGIHVLSSFLVAVSISGQDRQTVQIYSSPDLSLPEALRQALMTMAVICGWVILFRIILAFLQLWILWHFPKEYQAAIAGFLELSNGCCELPIIPSLPLRFVVCSCMLAFGGICVFMQTLSVTQGLSLRFYVAGKLLQTIYSFLLSVGIAYQVTYFSFPVLLLTVSVLRKAQKKSSIHAAVGV